MSEARVHASRGFGVVLLAFGVVLASSATTGCIIDKSRPLIVRRPHRHGPPPHAPAHGYRHKHRGGIELVFDSGLGVYAVVGYPGIYFYRDSYYKLVDSSWRISARIDGGWRAVAPDGVPHKLFVAKSPKSKHRFHGRGRGRGH